MAKQNGPSTSLRANGNREVDVLPNYGPPTKRSVTIAGHETSISLEPMFWDRLERAADEERLPLNALIAQIDMERLGADPTPNLTSAIRQWLLARALHQRGDE